MRLNECHGLCGFQRRWAGSTLLGLLLAVALARPSVGAEIAPTESLAEVNGEAIAAAEVERALGMKLSQLEEQIYNLKRQELDALIAQRLLAQEAARRSVSVAGLLDAEVTSKIDLVTEKEVEDFYQQNKARVSGDEADIRQKIRAFLQQRKLAARRKIFVESLRSQAKVLVRLEPPTPPRIDVPVAGAPVRGAEDAHVTVVEFSDFQCSFCKQAHPILSKLLEQYPGKVKLIYLDFPLERIHPQARRAAQAARCANDQGKFWEYHDVLFAQSPRLSPTDLKRYARQVGLDTAKFETCLSSETHKATVQKDLDEGKKLGVTSTPAFFINGRPLQGAQSFEAFVRVIEEELARVTASRSGSR
jgi:protein-disulfide isomerase